MTYVLQKNIYLLSMSELLTVMLFNCILICYGAYFNYPVLVLVYTIIWF